MAKKKWKSVNVNFLLILMVIILIFVFAFIVSYELSGAEAELSGVKTSINEIRGQDEIDDVEGYGLIAYGAAYAIGGFALVLAKIIFVWLPVLYAFYLLFSSGVARIIFAPSKGRLLAYRILMGFAYEGLIFIGIIMISLCCAFDNVAGWVLRILLAAIFLAILIINIFNTYTKRILIGYVDDSVKIEGEGTVENA